MSTDYVQMNRLNASRPPIVLGRPIIPTDAAGRMKEAVV